MENEKSIVVLETPYFKVVHSNENTEEYEVIATDDPEVEKALVKMINKLPYWFLRKNLGQFDEKAWSAGVLFEANGYEWVKDRKVIILLSVLTSIYSALDKVKPMKDEPYPSIAVIQALEAGKVGMIPIITEITNGQYAYTIGADNTLYAYESDLNQIGKRYYSNLAKTEFRDITNSVNSTNKEVLMPQMRVRIVTPDLDTYGIFVEAYGDITKAYTKCLVGIYRNEQVEYIEVRRHCVHAYRTDNKDISEVVGLSAWQRIMNSLKAQ